MFLRNLFNKTILRDTVVDGGAGGGNGGGVTLTGPNGVSAATQGNISKLQQAGANNEAFSTAAGEVQQEINMQNTTRGVVASVGR